eukprot:4231602-Alexandrium_andersonii.AAC.1
MSWSCRGSLLKPRKEGIEMGDAGIADVADFGAHASEEAVGPAWPEGSGGHGAGSGAQQVCDDAPRAWCCGPLRRES